MTIRTLFASWRHLRHFEHWITTEGDASLQPIRWRRPFAAAGSRKTKGAAAGFPQAVLGRLGLRGQPPSFGQRGEVHPRQGRLKNWLSTPRCLASTRCKYKTFGQPVERRSCATQRSPSLLCDYCLLWLLTWPMDSQALLNGLLKFGWQQRGQIELTDKENGRKPSLQQQSFPFFPLAVLFFKIQFWKRTKHRKNHTRK